MTFWLRPPGWRLTVVTLLLLACVSFALAQEGGGAANFGEEHDEAATVSPDDTERLALRLQEGGLVQLGPGTYVLEDNVWLTRSVTLAGSGPNETTIEIWPRHLNAPAISWFPTESGGFVMRDIHVKLMMSADQEQSDDYAHVTAAIVGLFGGSVELERVIVEGTGHGGDGVLFVGDTRGTITDSIIAGNGRQGVKIRDDANVTLERVSIRHNGSVGVGLEGGSATVRASTVRFNDSVGIWVSASGTYSIESSWIAENGSHGIYVTGFSRPDIVQNEIEANGGFGVLVEISAGPLVQSNRISANVEGGIKARQRAYPTIVQNLIEMNAGDGVSLAGFAGGSVTGNQIERNSGVGIGCGSGTRTLLEANVFFDNAGGDVAGTDTGCIPEDPS